MLHINDARALSSCRPGERRRGRTPGCPAARPVSTESQPERIRVRKHRDRIDRGRNDNGDPLRRVGDVMGLLVKDPERRERKNKK